MKAGKPTKLSHTRLIEILETILKDSYNSSNTGLEEYTDPASRRIVSLLHSLAKKQRSLRETTKQLRIEDSDRLKKIIESTPIGICITNQAGVYEYVNPNYCRLYGYNRQELLGNHFSMVVPPEYQEKLSDLHDRFMERKYELRGEWRVQKKGGSPLDIIADAAYIVDIDGKPKKVTFVVDITERKQLEHTREAVERIVRHDMKNPLNGIIGATEVLLMGELEEQERELCTMVRDSAWKVNTMLSTSVDIIRMEQGKYVLQPVPLDVRKIMRTVEQELAAFAEAKKVGITIKWEAASNGPPQPFTITGERIYLENMFANLIRNAIEGSNRGDTVTAIFQQTESAISAKIHNAQVVPPTIRERFFERYATSGKEGGTGLGTYTAKLIIEVHGGTIDFTTSEQAGTTVTVTLPKTAVSSRQIPPAKG